MAKEEIKRALEGRGKKTGKTHTHSVHYERASNGGIIAHVHKHHGKGPHSEGPSHSEEHVLPDMEAAQAHLDEHMGDQPAAGELQGAPPPQPQGGGPEEMGGAEPAEG